MTVSIVSNLASQYARQALEYRSEQVASSTQKLSSGQRVFSAQEDSAALSVGSALKVDLAVLRTAQLNVGTGVSMLQIAEGALGEIGEIVTRMRSLASQASSGQLEDSQRALLDLEYQSLISEIDRISSDTEFNGTQLLSGDAAYTVSQAHTLATNGVGNFTFASDVVNSDATFRYTYDSTDETLTVNRIEDGTLGTETIDITQFLDNVAGTGQNLVDNDVATINFGNIGVSLELDANFDRAADILPAVTDNSGADIAITTPTMIYDTDTVTDEAVTALQALGSAYNPLTGVLTLDLQTDGAAVTLAGVTGLRYDTGSGVGADAADSADLVNVGADSFDVYVTTASGQERLATIDYAALATTGTTNGQIEIPLGTGLFNADFSASGGNLTATFKVSGGITVGEDLVQVSLQAANAEQLGLNTSSIASEVAATQAVNDVVAAIDIISAARAQIGGDQSRLEFISRNLAVAEENSESARATLLDVNVAEEISNLTNHQSMMQVGVSMLREANLQTDILLQLLRNG